jgi:hypothetical protein
MHSRVPEHTTISYKIPRPAPSGLDPETKPGAFSVVGRASDAVRLLDVARDSGLKPNIFMYSSAVSASRHDAAEVRNTRILDPFGLFPHSYPRHYTL